MALPPLPPRYRLPAALALLSALLTALVAARWGPLCSLDVSLAVALHRTAVADPSWTDLNRLLSDWVWDPWTMRVVLAGAVLWLVRRGARRLAVWVAGTALAGTALQQSLKAAVGRARPTWPDPVASAGYAAFPSGHALSVLVAGVLVLWLLRLHGVRPRVRWAARAAVAVSAAGVGFTRVQLGVHWLSDVVGGWLVGGALVTGAIAAYGPGRPSGLGPGPCSGEDGGHDDLHRHTRGRWRARSGGGARMTTSGTAKTPGAGAINGVLFDFSGTLMRIESAETWLRAALEASGTAMDDAEVARQAAALERAGALPGGSLPAELPGPLADLWEIRDRDPAHHRALYTGLARQVPLPRPELYDALYERHMTAQAWNPYPDAAGVLARLRELGIRVGVLSNIGWDLRPVLRAHGLDRHIDSYVLSYEHGIQKPDPELFARACEALGLPPSEVLMVGDDRTADGGATAVGCAYLPVDPLPVERRPDGLRPVLERVGRTAAGERA